MKWIADLDSFVIGHTVNSVLCAAIGALLGGVRGGLIGVAAGMVLTVLPPASRLASHWLGVIARGFIVVAGLPVALAMLAVARGAHWLALRLAPVLNVLAPAMAGVGRSARAVRATAARSCRAPLACLPRRWAWPISRRRGAGARLHGHRLRDDRERRRIVILVLMLLVDEDERRHAAADER